MLPLDEDFVRVAEKLKRAYNRQEPNLGPLTPASTVPSPNKDSGKRATPLATRVPAVPSPNKDSGKQ